MPINNKYVHSCNGCTTRCDGRSKGVYIFKNDAKFSEGIEDDLIKLFNEKVDKQFKKTSKSGYPDITVFDKANRITCYIEVKVQQRTFMSVSRLLPNSDLTPSETLALNLSDLKRYFEIYDTEKVPIYLIWALLNRPCVLKDKDRIYFYQRIEELRKVFQKYEMKRRWRRKSGSGDIVDGVHKWVVVNYHFSLNEFAKDIDRLISDLQ